MEQTHPFLPDIQHFVITNTHQYNQFLNFFIQGVHCLEYHMNVPEDDRLYSPSKVSNLAEKLALMVKSLTFFLGYLVKQRPTLLYSRFRGLQCLRKTWLREAISNLRIYCYRYSSVGVKIVHALERQRPSAALEDNGFGSAEREIIFSSGIGLDARTSASSWCSRMGTAGGSSSASVDQSYHDNVEVIQNWMSKMTVEEDLNANTGCLSGKALVGMYLQGLGVRPK